MTGFVGGLDGEELHHLAKVRVELGEEAGGDEQRRGLVLDEIRHDLNDGVLDRGGELARALPVDGGRRIPLRGGGLLVEARGLVGPDDGLAREREVEVRAARLDQRAARREPPARRGLVGDGLVGRAARVAGALGGRPAVRQRYALHHPSDPGRESLPARIGAILGDEVMAGGAAPGGQVDRQVWSATDDLDALARPRGGEALLDQQVAADVEAEIAEVDETAHPGAAEPARASHAAMVSKRSTACSSC